MILLERAGRKRRGETPMDLIRYRASDESQKLNFERNEQMKNKNGIYIIGVDHGYGNIKTANYCFPTGVESSDTEPTFKNDLLIYQGRYYQIGVGHKEYVAEKVMDEDYYILTLAAIARELSREPITQTNVFLAVGLPLSWVRSSGRRSRRTCYRIVRWSFLFGERITASELWVRQSIPRDLPQLRPLSTTSPEVICSATLEMAL